MTEQNGVFRLPESARFLQDDHSIEVPFGLSAQRPFKVAVVAHIFHPEMTQRIRRLIDHIPGCQTLFISTTSVESQQAIESQLQQAQPLDHLIKVTENRGRDLPSKTTLFNQEIRSFDLVLFLHSKQSNHHELLGTWCDYLFESLAGSLETVESIQTLFAVQPDLGLVAPQHYELMRQFVNWGHDFSITQSLLKRVGVDITNTQPSDFPSGMMFWARPQALNALHGLNILMGDYPKENGAKDGTLAHAIERGMFYLCEASGYRWLKIAHQGYCPNTPGILCARSPDELIDNIKLATFSLVKQEPGYSIRTPLTEHITQAPPALMAKISK